MESEKVIEAIGKLPDDARIRINPDYMPDMTATLIASSRHATCAIIFGFWCGKWWIWDAAPYIRGVLRNQMQPEHVAERLEAKGFHCHWTDDIPIF